MTLFLKQLLHVKEVRKTNAARALQRKRRELHRAEQRLAEAKLAHEVAVAGHEGQIDALYEPLIGQRIGLGGMQEVESRVADLDGKLQEIRETVDDCADHVADLKDDAEALAQLHAEKSRAFERLGALIGNVDQVLLALAERQAELELEEAIFDRKGLIP